jgi:hypothetical protein
MIEIYKYVYSKDNTAADAQSYFNMRVRERSDTPGR